MDCQDFDGQVVRLESLQDLGNKFILVRLTRIDGLDLNLFDFDYDLTLAFFFMNSAGKIYSRYGSRDATSADSRHSLKGLRHTMESVLKMHEKTFPAVAEPRVNSPDSYSQLMRGRGINGCAHCHQVREALNHSLVRSGKWEREMIWRFPFPENAGLVLDVDKGNQVARVIPESPAQKAGILKGDDIRFMNGLPIHSLADFQYALDRSPKEGKVKITWQRNGQSFQSELEFAKDWKKSDLSWRPSQKKLVPLPGIYGANLTVNEKKSLGISATQLAFRHKDSLSDQAKAAGIRGGDIITGVKDKTLEMDVDGFFEYIRQNYLVGESVPLELIREGKKMQVSMLLVR
ncbi:MAG: PDZ domain-containing protein [Gemmataceae bacterium]|nr:PDZ domain-containing protein [Gemmataceae bacterium]